MDCKHLRHGGSKMIRLRTSLRPAVVLALAAATVLGCAKRENEIVIGEYGSLTGSTATFGVSTKNGIELYVDNVNAAGGAGGAKLHGIVADDQSKLVAAATSASDTVDQVSGGA